MFCPIVLKGPLCSLFIWLINTVKSVKWSTACRSPRLPHSPCTNSTFFFFFFFFFYKSKCERREEKVKPPLSPLHDTHFYLVTSICPFCILLHFTRAKWNSHLDIPLWCFPTTKWHFILTFPLPVISMWSHKTCRAPRFTASRLLFKCFLSFSSFPPSWVQIKQFCQETVSINWTSLPCIQGINFITWMGGHSLFLLSLWIDGNEMELTLDPYSSSDNSLT